MSVIDRTAREFARLPGIGPRSALRLVQHLVRGSKEDARRLSSAISELMDRIRFCDECGNVSEADLCPVCASAERDRTVLCVVEGPFDSMAIERTDRFSGLYHVLGGRISPLDGVGPDQLNIAALLRRVEGEGPGIGEVILATSPTLEGEATAVYLERILRPRGVRVTRIARGIPMGSDLEYVDGTTLAEAFAGRREIGNES